MPKQLFFKLLIGFWLICVLIAGTIVALPAIIEQQLDPEHQQSAIHQQFASRLAKSPDLKIAIIKIQQHIAMTRPMSLQRKIGRQHKIGRRKSLFVVDRIRR